MFCVFILNNYYYNYFYYFSIFILGQIFCKYNNESKSAKIIIFLIYLIAIFSILFIKNKIILDLFQQIIIYSGTIVFFYISQLIKNNKTLLMIGAYSFYIYLLHEPLLFKFIFKIFCFLNLAANYLYIPIAVGFTIFFSIVIYKIIQKLNIHKWIL
jgi:peptidoglycan/LPS O-acetylase OafA/YrhL